MSEPEVRATGEASEVQSSQLQKVLLQPAEAPEGLAMDRALSGPVEPSLLEAELRGPGEPWPPEGFIEAVHHLFRLSEPLDPEATDAAVRGVVNLGILFEDQETASAFLDRSFPPEFVLKDARPHGYGDLGEERRGLRTEASAERPVRTTLIWRRGSLFLQLNVFGDYSIEQIMSWALTVDQRA